MMSCKIKLASTLSHSISISLSGMKKKTKKHSQFHCLGLKLETFTVLGNLCSSIPVDVSHRPAAALILAQRSA